MQILKVAASGLGALAGYSYVCPRCGMELTSTLETMLRADASKHLAWHEQDETSER